MSSRDSGNDSVTEKLFQRFALGCESTASCNKHDFQKVGASTLEISQRNPLYCGALLTLTQFASPLTSFPLQSPKPLIPYPISFTTSPQFCVKKPTEEQKISWLRKVGGGWEQRGENLSKVKLD